MKKQKLNPKQILNKKICQFCQNNEYGGKYNSHLKGQHSDIMSKRELIRNIIKTFDNQQLETIKKLVLELKK